MDEVCQGCPATERVGLYYAVVLDDEGQRQRRVIAYCDDCVEAGRWAASGGEGNLIPERMREFGPASVADSIAFLAGVESIDSPQFDAGLRRLQDAANQKDGGPAALYWTGVTALWSGGSRRLRLQLVMQYLESELEDAVGYDDE